MRTKALAVNFVFSDSTNEKTFDVALAALLRSLPLLTNLTALDILMPPYMLPPFFGRSHLAPWRGGYRSCH